MGAENTNEEHSPDNERFTDNTGMHILTEEKMWCNSCRFCEDNVLSCGIYAQKPDAVMDGDECPYYDPKQ